MPMTREDFRKIPLLHPKKAAKDADKATSISQQRKQSVEAIEKLLEKRLFKNAAKQALKQLDEYDDQYSGADLLLYYQALTRLNALDDSTNLDTILQEQMKRHGGNPYFLMDAAHLYQNASHTFKLVDGAYIRSAEPWDGEYSGEARDGWKPCGAFPRPCNWRRRKRT